MLKGAVVKVAVPASPPSTCALFVLMGLLVVGGAIPWLTAGRQRGPSLAECADVMSRSFAFEVNGGEAVRGLPLPVARIPGTQLQFEACLKLEVVSSATSD